MEQSKPAVASERVLILAPFGRDGQMIGEALERSQVAAQVCGGLDAMYEELTVGAGAILLADEALNGDAVQRLAALLEAQPRWSDLPILVMTSGGEATYASQHRLKLLAPLGNVTLLERPFRSVTLLSAVETALRARRRQYEIAAYLQERDALLTQLRESDRIYRGIGESIDFGIWVCTPDGRNNYASDSFLKLVGRTQEQWSGMGWVNTLHPDDVGPIQAEWARCVAGGVMWDRVQRVLGADGRWHPVLARGVPIRNDTGQILCWAGINLDISREKQAEAALQEANEALRRSNSDLEQFAYAASHDLQEPLRNVTIYTQLLASRYASTVDPTAAEFVGTIVGSAKRMGMLISDLLAYTRAARIEDQEPEFVAAQSVLMVVLADLDTVIAENHATITFDPLPQVKIHAVHLQQVFQNLLSNALKYRGADPPQIHIGVCSDANGFEFSVVDNGIGIDPQFAQRIFGIFRRLHTGAEYAGTGVGLAICQKIVERYGGRIWVESEVGNGAAFRFTLPN